MEKLIYIKEKENKVIKIVLVFVSQECILAFFQQFLLFI